MKFHKLILCGTLLTLWSSCIKSTVEPIENDSSAPGPLTDVTWKAIPGGAEISYELPTDNDLLYARASYTTKTGVRREFKASIYTNTLRIEGIGDTDTYNVLLEAVDRSENHSAPVYIDIIPDTPPVVQAFESLDVTEDFGGITISFTNETKADLVFEVLTANEENEMTVVESFYTALPSATFSVRGYEDTPREFQIRVRDKYDNYSETFVGTYTPVYEKLLDKSLFRELLLPGDADCNAWSCKMEYIWDGRIVADSDGRTGCHTGSDGSRVPKYFTFDMGVKAKLSRFQLWQLQDDKHWFNDVSPRNYQIWGCADTPPSDGSWDNWVLLTEVENIKPSGYPVGVLSEDDRIAGRNGDSGNFANDLPAVRYIRIRCLKNWSGNTNMTFTEISFWGDDKVQQ